MTSSSLSHLKERRANFLVLPLTKRMTGAQIVEKKEPVLSIKHLAIGYFFTDASKDNFFLQMSNFFWKELQNRRCMGRETRISKFKRDFFLTFLQKGGPIKCKSINIRLFWQKLVAVIPWRIGVNIIKEKMGPNNLEAKMFGYTKCVNIFFFVLLTGIVQNSVCPRVVRGRRSLGQAEV